MKSGYRELFHLLAQSSKKRAEQLKNNCPLCNKPFQRYSNGRIKPCDCNKMNPSDKDTLNTLSHVIKDEIIFVQVNNKDGKWRATRNNNCGYGATKKKAESDLLELERFMRITKKL